MTIEILCLCITYLCTIVLDGKLPPTKALGLDDLLGVLPDEIKLCWLIDVAKETYLQSVLDIL